MGRAVCAGASRCVVTRRVVATTTSWCRANAGPAAIKIHATARADDHHTHHHTHAAAAATEHARRAGRDREVLKQRLAAVAEAGRLDRDDVEHAAHLVHDERLERLARDVLSDDEERLLDLDHRLEQRDELPSGPGKGGCARRARPCVTLGARVRSVDGVSPQARDAAERRANELTTQKEPRAPSNHAHTRARETCARYVYNRTSLTESSLPSVTRMRGLAISQTWRSWSETK